MQEELAEAIALLLESRWIARAADPEGYALIRRCETKLKAYFREKCGWLFVRNPRFYKLEKIPAVPEAWMGVQSFVETDDYVLLCCTMAYLEEREIEEQFLLSELCEDLLALYPESALHPLRWEVYTWRRSLVRTLGFLLEADVLRVVEDDSEGFLQDRGGEALYEVTVLARYFLRTYPKDLQEYRSLEELCRADFLGGDGACAAQPGVPAASLDAGLLPDGALAGGFCLSAQYAPQTARRAGGENRLAPGSLPRLRDADERGAQRVVPGAVSIPAERSSRGGAAFRARLSRTGGLEGEAAAQFRGIRAILRAAAEGVRRRLDEGIPRDEPAAASAGGFGRDAGLAHGGARRGAAACDAAAGAVSAERRVSGGLRSGGGMRWRAINGRRIARAF